MRLCLARQCGGLAIAPAGPSGTGPLEAGLTASGNRNASGDQECGAGVVATCSCRILSAPHEVMTPETSPDRRPHQSERVVCPTLLRAASIGRMGAAGVTARATCPVWLMWYMTLAPVLPESSSDRPERSGFAESLDPRVSILPGTRARLAHDRVSRPGLPHQLHGAHGNPYAV